jgi:hypothetical protein
MGKEMTACFVVDKGTTDTVKLRAVRICWQHCKVTGVIFFFSKMKIFIGGFSAVVGIEGDFGKRFWY